MLFEICVTYRSRQTQRKFCWLILPCTQICFQIICVPSCFSPNSKTLCWIVVVCF
jgi:hypothetical protein